MIIINTRPDAEPLTQMISSLGLQVMHYPVVKINRMPPESYKQTLEEVFPQLTRIVFTSANAVEQSFAPLRELLDKVKNTPKLYAVGKKTADFATSLLGLHVYAPIDHFSSESLLAMTEWQKLDDEEVLIIGAPNSRGLLESEIPLRGGRCHEVHVYKRTIAQRIKDLPENQDLLVISTSRESMDNFLKLYPEVQEELAPYISWLVPSLRMKQIVMDTYHATEKSVHLANNATDEALVAYIMREVI